LSDAFLGAAPNATGLQLYFSSMPERKTRPAGKQATLFYSFLVLFFFLNVYPFKKNKKKNKNKRREQKKLCVCLPPKRSYRERERERDWAYNLVVLLYKAALADLRESKGRSINIQPSKRRFTRNAPNEIRP
jgi:hypothetical protein